MQNLRKSLIFNVFFVLMVLLAMYIVLFFSLHLFTRHGEEVILPAVTGKSISEAVAQLEELNFNITIDSMYEASEKPLTVLKQVPDSGAIVKDGRTIILTINRLTPPSIPMPDLTGLSFHSAVNVLRCNRLFVGDTIYKPHPKSKVVLEQYYMKYPLKPGTSVSQGSKIDLVLGDGMGNTEHKMPDVLNIKYEMAEIILSQLNLQVEIIPKNANTIIPDTGLAMVIGQDPKPDATIREGDKVRLTVE